MSAERGRGNRRGGFRVFRVHVDRGNLERLRQLFRDFVNGKARTRGALCYREEWMAEWENVLRMREEAGKRTVPNPPAATLLVRFVMPDGSMRGDGRAPCIIDLRRGELRIPSYGVAMPLRRSLVKALIEENELNPRPGFTLQITRRGFVRVIAQREAYSELATPLRIITIDENSSYGFTIAYWRIDETRASMAGFEKLRPPNHGYRRGVASLLQSYADKPSGEAKQRLAEALPEEVLRTLTAERARELAEATRRKERRLNNAFVERPAAKARRLIREARRQGVNTLILLDAINPQSLRGTELQGTLLRARRHLKNLAMYEGAMFRLARASGMHCPRCGSEGEEARHTKRSRIYRCPRCGLEWDRDKGVHCNLVYAYFARMVKEESDDLTALATRILEAMREWLARHPNILQY
jgi:ribosomal protein S27AE